MIDYRTGNDLSPAAFIDLLRASTLGERRPVDDLDRITRMIGNANLVITAWDGSLAVGIARSLSDFAYCTYLSDLAVHVDYQRTGIGKELIRRTQQAAPQANLILLAAPKAVDYYPHIGFNRHQSAWILRPSERLRPDREP